MVHKRKLFQPIPPPCFHQQNKTKNKQSALLISNNYTSPHINTVYKNIRTLKSHKSYLSISSALEKTKTTVISSRKCRRIFGTSTARATSEHHTFCHLHKHRYHFHQATGTCCAGKHENPLTPKQRLLLHHILQPRN